MSEEPTEILGEKFTNCDPYVDGVPLCRLGQMTGKDKFGNNLKPNTIHLKGACASECMRKMRCDPAPQRDYKMMFIGGGLGSEEDNLGIPFVGRSSDNLMGFIESAGIDPEEVYITYMVKCRPPGRREPATGERKACLAHLYHEIRTIQPKVIVLLGRIPLQLFNLDKIGGIMKNRGKLFTKALPHWEDGPEFKIVPTLDPAYFLHQNNPKLRTRVRNDFVFAKNLLTSGNMDKSQMIYTCQHEIADTVEKVRAMTDEVKAHKIFGFDTESPDLDFKNAPMRTIQISIGPGKTWVIPFYRHNAEMLGPWKMEPHFLNGDKEKVIRILAELFEDPDIVKAAHNIKYDMNVIKRWTGLITVGMLWDTAIMHHLLYEYPPHTLEHLADEEFAVGDYSFLVREIVGHGRKLIKTYDWIPDEVLWPYGAMDAEATYRLVGAYFERLSRKPHLMKLYMEESFPTILSLQEFEWTGNKIIIENVKKLEAQLKQEIEDLTAKCHQHTKPDFNPGSPDQVKDALLALGYSEEIFAPEKAKGFSTAKDILTEIDHDLARSVVAYRNRTKLLGTYVENVLEDIRDDGRVYYGFNPSGPTNGRLSAPLLHQMPRIDQEAVDKGAAVLRSIFGEDEGYVYMYGDFSQVELRIFAYLTGEQELIDYLEQGKDIHRLSAAAALDIVFEKVTDTNRANIGKPINFGAIYGSKGFSLAKLEFDDPVSGRKRIIGKERASRMVQAFRRHYRKVDDYLYYVPEQALINGGVVQSVFGRERRMMNLNDANKGVREHAEREATNFTISSPAAAITLRTINAIRVFLKENQVGLDLIRPVNTVHDSIAYGVHESMVDWFGPCMKAIAEREIPEVHGKIFPMKYGVGKTWTEAELNAA